MSRRRCTPIAEHSASSTAGPALQPNEVTFVPDRDDSGEGEGWLLTFVWDKETDRSVLGVLDATDVGSGPVATVELPQRVPFGFHGTWLPGAPDAT